MAQRGRPRKVVELEKKIVYFPEEVIPFPEVKETKVPMPLATDLGREDLNAIARKVNEVIEYLNASKK